MTESRLRELGIPRRGFLAKAAGVAFAAPVVASFSLDGTAEADGFPWSFGNQVQCFGNQPSQFYANQFASGEAGRTLNSMLADVLQAIDRGTLKTGPALDPDLGWQLASTVLLIMIQAVSGNPDVCRTLGRLQTEIGFVSSRLPGGLGGSLLSQAEQVARELRCVCTVGPTDRGD